ncbi:stage V sporulation protein D [Alicyclobacillus contaminans]|nr:stage V sporulation protein D [Alicyclobacillus contaminans]
MSQRASRHRKRVIGMQALFIGVLGLVAARIIYVQQVFGPGLLAKAEQVEQVKEVVLSQRGALLDRNGHPLAYDVPAYLLDVKTDAFPDLSLLASKLSPILGASTDVVLKKLQSGAHWVQWPTPILETDKEKIQSLLKDKAIFGSSHIDDATFTPTEERVYPYGSFAANTLGFVDNNGVGKAGLEAEYNSLLSGQNGEVTYTQDNLGFPLQTTMRVTKPAVPGKNIELTIDQTIQGFVEAKMDELMKQYNPDHAAIIVTNPQTGEILGMASRPTYDPNHYATANPEALYSNWAVNEAFEPGSTFKMLTLAAGLATHVISLDDTFHSGSLTVAGRTIHDWNGVGWGTITFRQALEESSNVGFATVALKLGWSNLLKYMQDFGFLQPTGVDLPNEANSIVFAPASRGKVQLATSGFGQGIAVTPLQQVAAYGAIANGGKLIQPHLAKAVVDPTTGKVLKSFTPVVKNPQVVPKDVVQQVNDTLVLDVSEGIDSVGKIPGYDVAGKTGTANVMNDKGGYYLDRFIVSFIGYAPAENPQFEVYVTLDWPKTPESNTWGSTVATPAARDILEECLQYAHIPPKSGTQSHSQQPPAASATKYVQTPNVTGQSPTAASNELKKLGLASDVLGNDGMITGQWPEPGVEVPVGSKMYLWAPGTGNGSGIMPDLRGTSMREAGDILAAMGVSMTAQGDGFAVSQSIPAGQPVKRGQTVTVVFAPPQDPVTQAVSAAASASRKSSAANDSGSAEG